MSTEANISRPSVGLALSGSGSRFPFYIGFLEELQKANVPIDYIAACSGGSIVAAAFACGRLDALKDLLLRIDKKTLFSYLKRKGKGGLYNLDSLEELGRSVISQGLRFEEVRPVMGFVAVDIENGEQIVMSMGDIARAVRISCTIPAVCEPVKWGGRTLIDGGLLSIIPVDVLKQAGMDITISVNMRGTKHMFTEGQMTVRKVMKLFRKALLIEYIEKIWDLILPEDEEEYRLEETPGIFSVLGRSIDLAIAASKKDYSKILESDLTITPDISRYKIKNFEKSIKELYELGRKTAWENIPKIQKLILDKQKVIAQ